MARKVAGPKPKCSTPECKEPAFRDGMCGKCYMRHHSETIKAARKAAVTPIVPPAAPAAGKVPRLKRQTFKTAGRGSHIKIMEKMEGVLTALFTSLENLGGPKYIEEALASDGKSYTLLKEILALGKKYMDFKAQEAESKRAHESQNGPINYFVIKNLRIDPNDTGLISGTDIEEEELGLAEVFKKLKQPDGKEYQS